MKHKAMVDNKNDVRVLHVVDVLSPSSGVANDIINCVKGIGEVTQDVVAYGFCDVGMKSIVEAAGGNVYRLPNVKNSLGQQFHRAFKELLITQPYSIIHGHLVNSAFIYLREAKHQGIPHRVIHAHSAQMSDTTIKRIRNKALSKGIPLWANNYVAVSSLAAHRVFGNNPNVHIVSNGVDTDLFRYNEVVRMDVRSELGLSQNTLCVGHVARFSPIKNHGFLLEIFEILRKRVSCILVLVGDGDLETAIKSRVREKGLQNSIKFLGLRKDAHRLYQAFDVFLLPSISEGFGLVVVEAQCAGVGCIVSESVPNTVVCSDYIKFLPICDAKEWADEALKISKMTRTDGSSGVREAKLDSASMCANITQVYKTMLGSAVWDSSPSFR